MALMNTLPNEQRMADPTLATLGGTPPATPAAAPDYGNLSDPATWMALVGNVPQLTQWVQQYLGPNADPNLVNYYVGKIQGQPGANPTEQAGSAGYWQQKIQSDPSLTGRPGGLEPTNTPGSPGYNPNLPSLHQPIFGAGNTTIGALAGGDPESIMKMDPGYQFRLGEGLKGIERGAAARGTLLTGGTQKALERYGQDYASGEFGNIFNRNLSLAQLGENAAAGVGNFGGQYAANAGNLLTGYGNAGAAGTVGAANAWGGTLGGLSNDALLYYLLNQNKGSGAVA